MDLLEWLGPFRLAYLEAILRAADMRVSMKEAGGPQNEHDATNWNCRDVHRSL